VNVAGALSVIIAGVSLLGLRSAFFMYGKTQDAERGRLQEESVVELPEARVFFSLPNALVGIVYYSAAIALACFTWSSRTLAAVLVALALGAFATSIYLAARLIIRKRPCPYCWTSHAVNAALLFLALAQFFRKA
jgi:uncharacterized membrane protein